MLARLCCFPQPINLSLAYGIVTHILYGPLRGPLSRFDDMNADHLKLLGYEDVLLQLQPVPQFYRGRMHCTDL